MWGGIKPNRLAAALLAAPVTLAGCASLTSSNHHEHADSADPGHETVAYYGVAGSPTGRYTPTAKMAQEILEGEGVLTGIDDGLIWGRLRRGYALADYSEHPVVRNHIEWYSSRPDFLERVTGRGKPYLHHIVEAIEGRGLPAELVAIPIVESAFQPLAYSHARASGIWQFMPATGRRFGLDQNWWYDGRRDIAASTRAALDYLEILNNHFDGDWLLTLAAYNAGEGTVMRAVRRNRDRGLPTDFWNLDLPRETRGYVPRLLAVSALIADPEGYGVRLWPVADEPYLELVELDGQIDLAVAADLAGIELDNLYTLNPGFNRWATAPNGPHHLLLPREKADTFRAGLASLPPERRITWHRHRIVSGDTLSQIAARYGTTSSVLREANQLRGDTIRAGRHLLVPMAAKSADDYSLTAERRLEGIQAAGGRQQLTHVVRRGDTLWDIARKYGVGTSELARWNGMATSDTLRINQRLVVRAGGGAVAAAAPGRGPSGTVQVIRYSVRSGDSLYTIARRHGVRIADIRQWNNLAEEATLLRPGQSLTLHVNVTGG